MANTIFSYLAQRNLSERYDNFTITGTSDNHILDTPISEQNIEAQQELSHYNLTKSKVPVYKCLENLYSLYSNQLERNFKNLAPKLKNSHHSFQDLLKSIQSSESFPQNFSAEALKKISLTERKLYTAALCSMPKQALIHYFDLDTLLWIFLQHPMNRPSGISYAVTENVSKEILQKLSPQAKPAEEIKFQNNLTKAKNCLETFQHDYVNQIRTQDLKAALNLFNSIQTLQYKLQSQELNLAKELKLLQVINESPKYQKINKFTKNKFDLELYVNKRNSIHESIDKWHLKTFDNKAYSVVTDAPISLIVKYKDKPAAIVSFAPLNSDTLIITQFQEILPLKLNKLGEHIKFQDPKTGVIKNKKDISGIMSSTFQNFQTPLFKLVENFASQFNFNQIVIQGGDNNYWCSQYYDKQKKHVHLPKARAHKVYDEFADKVLQYSFDQQSGNWFSK